MDIFNLFGLFGTNTWLGPVATVLSVVTCILLALQVAVYLLGSLGLGVRRGHAATMSWLTFSGLFALSAGLLLGAEALLIHAPFVFLALALALPFVSMFVARWAWRLIVASWKSSGVLPDSSHGQ